MPEPQGILRADNFQIATVSMRLLNASHLGTTRTRIPAKIATSDSPWPVLVSRGADERTALSSKYHHPVDIPTAVIIYVLASMYASRLHSKSQRFQIVVHAGVDCCYHMKAVLDFKIKRKVASSGSPERQPRSLQIL